MSEGRDHHCHHYDLCRIALNCLQFAVHNCSAGLLYTGLYTAAFIVCYSQFFAVFSLPEECCPTFLRNIASILKVTRIGELGTALLVFLRSVLRLLVTSNFVSSSPIRFTLMMEAKHSSEMFLTSHTM
jgi:hypothetical protein